MKLFRCQHCWQLLYFENTRCERCSRRLGYLPDYATLSALEEQGGAWRALAVPERTFLFCSNARHDVCNWLVPADQAAEGRIYCRACVHNGTIPDLSKPEDVHAWRRIEEAKHRLFYALLRLGLPLRTRADDPQHGLVFDFLADAPSGTGPKVMTGHDNGRITIALAEADDLERERRRIGMGEPYRTLLGHFRHEVGHHYWDLLVRDVGAGRLAAFRALFGDERADYGESLKRHHRDGPPPDWGENFVSSYATMHPWEDFAETWAHYLHIVDTLEIADAFGLKINARVDVAGELTTHGNIDPYREADVQTLVDAWLPLAFALNSLNRSMGHPDLYPFTLTPTVIEKIGFVQDLAGVKSLHP